MSDLQKMLHNLKTSLTAGTAPVGLQIAIYEGTKLRLSHGEGFAVVADGPTPERKMTTRVRMDVASISKTITAATVIRALISAPDVHRDSPVAPYLPADWKRGPNVTKLTFRMLLTHSGGLTAPGPFDTLQQNIEAGLPSSLPTAKSAYNNGNYDMFRIILPSLLYPDVVKTPTKDRVLRYGRLYLKACRELVLEPCGISNATVWGSGEKPFVRYYNNDKTSFAPAESEDFATRHAGAGFWFLSAREYGRFIANLRAGKVGKTVWSWMMKTNGPGDEFQAGMFKRSGKHGVYRAHNGGWGMGPGLRTGWLAFPDGVTGVVTANSPGTFGDTLDHLVSAYDNA